MKSERRHHLQQNELADQIGKARSWIEPYVVPILVGVIALTVVVMGVNYFQTQSVSGRSEATVELLFSTAAQPGVGEDAEAYARVAEQYPQLAAGAIAGLSKADIFLARGIDALYRDREEAKGLLDDAEKAYKESIESAPNKLYQSRAQFGLAKTLESKGDVEGAKKAYEQVVEINESEAMVKVAKERISLLDRTDIQEFLTWFSQQEPKSFDPVSPSGLPSGAGLPDMPNIQLPSVGPPADKPTEEAAGISDTINNALGGTTSDQPLPENPDIQVPTGDAAAGDMPVDPAGDAADGNEPEGGIEVPQNAEPAAEGAVTPEEPVTEEPVSEEPVTEEPVTEEPVTEEPKGDE